jgi:hypothetical protein
MFHVEQEVFRLGCTSMPEISDEFDEEPLLPLCACGRAACHEVWVPYGTLALVKCICEACFEAIAGPVRRMVELT